MHRNWQKIIWSVVLVVWVVLVFFGGWFADGHAVVVVASGGYEYHSAWHTFGI
jgi:hypothetical protein